MPSPLIELIGSVLISLTLVALGVYYFMREYLERRRNGSYAEWPAEDRRHYSGQFYRRAVGSSLLVAAGVAIFIGQGVLDWNESPRLYAWLWTGVLLGLLGIVSLAGADILAIQRYARRQRRKLSADRREMIERQLEQYRAERGSQSRLPPDFDVERN